MKFQRHGNSTWQVCNFYKIFRILLPFCNERLHCFEIFTIYTTYICVIPLQVSRRNWQGKCVNRFNVLSNFLPIGLSICQLSSPSIHAANRFLFWNQESCQKKIGNDSTLKERTMLTPQVPRYCWLICFWSKFNGVSVLGNCYKQIHGTAMDLLHQSWYQIW